MHSSIAVVFGVVAFCTLLDARSVGPYEGQYWPFAIPHRAARADADDVPKRTCGLVLVKLTKQICGEECAPPGMIPLELIDGTEQEPQRRKRMNRHELSFRCCTKGCTRAEIKESFCCNPSFAR